MNEDLNFEQKGGKNSTNIQGTNISLHYGISYSDAKEIALDIFQNNFLSLSEQAAETAKSRAEELVQNYLAKLLLKKPESINNIIDPGIQYALFTAQKEFARTGNKDIGEIFVEILIERMTLLERSMKQIVYDESLNIITKLTSQQIDILTIIFLLKYAPQSGSLTTDFKIEETLGLFGENINSDKSFIDHLIYSGTVIEGKTALSIENIFLSHFKYFISNGPSAYYSKDKAKIDQFKQTESLKQYFVPSPRNKDIKILAFLNEEDLISKLNANNISQEEIKLCLSVFRMSSHLEFTKITSYLKSQGDIMIKIHDCWNTSILKYLELTNVGLVIAQANYSRKTGKNVKLIIL